MNKYNDIIDMPHYTSKKYPRMSIKSRSSQFAPFNALTGFDDMIYETALVTLDKKSLTDDEKIILSEKLRYIENNLLNKANIKFVYFSHDKNKKDRKYIEKTGVVRKIDLYSRIVIFTDKTNVNMDDIIQIDIE